MLHFCPFRSYCLLCSSIHLWWFRCALTHIHKNMCVCSQYSCNGVFSRLSLSVSLSLALSLSFSFFLSAALSAYSSIFIYPLLPQLVRWKKNTVEERNVAQHRKTFNMHFKLPIIMAIGNFSIVSTNSILNSHLFSLLVSTSLCYGNCYSSLLGNHLTFQWNCIETYRKYNGSLERCVG